MDYGNRRRSSVPCWLWTVALLLFLNTRSAVLATSSDGGTLSDDAATLKRIQTAWGYPFALLNWLGNDPCSELWYGVECDSNRFVTALWLGESRLYGKIPAEIGDLKHLRALSLSTNGISGEIPPSLGNLKGLVKLELDQNRLEGSVPSSLAGLLQLKFLNLSFNEGLTGRIPGRLTSIPNLWYDRERICGKSTDPACANYPPAPAPAPAAAPVAHRAPPPTPKGQPPPPPIKPSQPPEIPSPPPPRPARTAPVVAPVASPSPAMHTPSPGPEGSLTPSVNQSASPCGGADGASWDCLCDGGRRGSQTCPLNGVFLGACQCEGECAPCQYGLVLQPGDTTESCVCARPLIIRVRLLNLSFHTFTPSMESTFLTNLAKILDLNRQQLLAVKRAAGSVILDILVTPLSSSANVAFAPAVVDKLRMAVAGSLSDPLLGPFDVAITDDGLTQLYPQTTGTVTPSSSPLREVSTPVSTKGSTLLISAFTMCVVATVVVLASAVFCIVMERRKGDTRRRYPKGFYQDEDLCQRLKSNSGPQSGELDPSGGVGGGGGRAESVPGTRARAFSYFELDEATSGFDRRYLIGSGGSSSVYRGRLAGNKLVAVKLMLKSGMGDFLKEVAILSRLHHVNLVELIGYSRDGNERVLVFEYMRNGTLRDHLQGGPKHRKPLSWEQRVSIALGAARGLEYLHESANPRILHRDFKSTNILLDMKLRAKVADFGTAKEDLEGSGGSSPALQQVLGTFGYFAPEYSLLGKASSKSDIFSFGVVLLELITGRQPVDMSRPEGQESLVLWANPMLLDERRVIEELADPRLKGRFPRTAICRMAHITWACLQVEPEKRPGMTEVVGYLKDLLPRHPTAMKSLSFSTWGGDEAGGASLLAGVPWLQDLGRGDEGECSKWGEDANKEVHCRKCSQEIESEPSPSQDWDPLDSGGSPSQETISLSFTQSLPRSPTPPASVAPASPGAYTNEMRSARNQEDEERTSDADSRRHSIYTPPTEHGAMYLVPL